MAITSEFSLQNTTVEIIDGALNSTAMATLRAAIKVATDNAAKVTAYTAYITDLGNDTPICSPVKISKITAIGETGKTFAVVSAKLVSESGTIKAKGSSDEGDLTLDFISIPNDAGQILVDAAYHDETTNANRVFRITHTSSSQVVYAIGMVTELKKTRGTVDNFSSVKCKITLQDGVTESNPA